MPFELIEEDQMAKKSKKKIVPLPKDVGINIIVTKKPVDIEKIKMDIPLISEEKTEKIEKIEKVEKIKEIEKVEKIKEIEKVEKTKEIEKVEKTKEIEKVDRTVITPKSLNVIVKRIYFPEDAYSKNQNEFKKILANYGLSWIRGMMRTYVSREGVKLLTGMYGSIDQNKKVFCIYEGTNKPMTAIVKVIGTGGNFLIDIISFGNRIGCVVEDKDDIYSNNIQLTLKEKGEIYVEKKLDGKIEDYQKIFEEKVQKYIEDRLKEYLDAYKESFERRGIGINTVLFFKRKEIEDNVRWGLENGFIKL